MHSFHDSNGFLPWNGSTAVGHVANQNNAASGSWGYMILPYVDQATVYSKANGAAGNAAVQVKISTFLCPGRERLGIQTGGTNGPQTDYGINTWINDPLKGFNSQVNNKYQLTDIKDGTSNTILLGHHIVQPYNYTNNMTSYLEAITNGGDGGTACSDLTKFTKDFNAPQPNNGSNTVGFPLVYVPSGHTGPDTWIVQFGSPFDEGCLMGMADGSVRMFSYEFNGNSLAPALRPNDGVAFVMPD